MNNISRKMTVSTSTDLFVKVAPSFRKALGVDVYADSEKLVFKFEKGTYSYTQEDCLSAQGLVDAWNVEYQIMMLIGCGMPYNQIKMVDYAKDQIKFVNGEITSVVQYWDAESNSIAIDRLLAKLKSLSKSFAYNNMRGSSGEDMRGANIFVVAESIEKGKKALSSAIKVSLIDEE